MATEKVIQVFLNDGVPNGRLSAEIPSWTGKAFKIPRKQIKNSSYRKELNKKIGVYFLFGKSETQPDQNAVYIGETEDVYKRLIQHQKLEFWNEAVVFTSTHKNLNKAHVKYLESKLYHMAIKAGRYSIENLSIPSCSSLSDYDQVTLLEYISNLRIILDTLGYKVLEPLAEPDEIHRNVYLIKGARGANGKAILTNEGIVVLAGSQVAGSTVPSMTESFIKRRQKLIDGGVIEEIKGKLIFSKDYLFSSPSAAASIVMGKNANGRIVLKNEKGVTLKSNEEK